MERLRLIDHHCHGVVARDLDRAEFEGLMNEGASAGPLGGSFFDSLLGLAIRRWCAPVLDLPAHAQPDEYLERRAELGFEEVNRRFLRAAGVQALCVDTGFETEALLAPAELAEASGARAHEIVRLERLAEELAATEVTAREFVDLFPKRLAERARNAVGVKSIAAYRVGLELLGERPDEDEVFDAARWWVASGERLAHETLHRFLIWCAVDLGLPIQFHVGYGDADVDLLMANPLLLSELLREIEPTGVPVMLLHNYPYHREAGYLAQVFSNVFVDVGLATHNVGRRAKAVMAELLELAPFGKVLYSSDAYGLAELHYLGAELCRQALGAFLDEGVAEGEWTADDAARIARLIGADNARRVYRL